jgi:hypothetical protein
MDTSSWHVDWSTLASARLRRFRLGIISTHFEYIALVTSTPSFVPGWPKPTASVNSATWTDAQGVEADNARFGRSWLAALACCIVDGTPRLDSDSSG